jgi:hypothetical protein
MQSKELVPVLPTAASRQQLIESVWHRDADECSSGPSTCGRSHQKRLKYRRGTDISFSQRLKSCRRSHVF